ncbi:HAD family hydrolase [uncultured Desulfuromonas sp.]|uniref:HAD family hydrolase n=1 Tax=uncultured Desulfuromonas sp. TaxID=181013 RepID=UPI002AAAEB3B|nr:HAD family hydrolase [uncultured Desulfuromonas sp.]
MTAKTLPQKITTVLFDLDGTLINVDMHKFVPAYLEHLASCIDPQMPPRPFIDQMIRRTIELLGSDDGRQTNEQYYWQVIEQDLGIPAQQFCDGLNHFFRYNMELLSPLVQPLPLATKLIQRCHEKGLELVLATNPVFPRPLVEARLNWGGMKAEDFSLITSFENSRYCKPNPHYFEDILDQLTCRAEQCLMVGNDTEHDLSASHLGMTTFLVDTWLIDRSAQFVADFRGSHLDLFRFLGQLPALS